MVGKEHEDLNADPCVKTCTCNLKLEGRQEDPWSWGISNPVTMGCIELPGQNKVALESTDSETHQKVWSSTDTYDMVCSHQLTLKFCSNLRKGKVLKRDEGAAEFLWGWSALQRSARARHCRVGQLLCLSRLHFFMNQNKPVSSMNHAAKNILLWEQKMV